MILKASAEKGSLSPALRKSSFSSSSMPLTGGRSAGDGRKRMTASSIACTPLFLNAVPQNTGMMLVDSVPARTPAMMSSSDNSPSSRYLFISSSDVSAAASTMNSRAALASSSRFAGMSPYTNDVPGGVDDVEAVGRERLVHAGPEARGGSGRDGDATLLLLLHPVHGCRAVVHFANLVIDA